MAMAMAKYKHHEVWSVGGRDQDIRGVIAKVGAGTVQIERRDRTATDADWSVVATTAAVAGEPSFEIRTPVGFVYRGALTSDAQLWVSA